ncbi:2-amino-4-hydroxy-6-hydroxymethyldihydropteridine diphosphokinase [Acidisoma cellulosilytica]|uniref:2-amino-4-hydroxy-6-hydroxymethyldihydropteridine pyrophosphokinase n=1 Tax=Acidisoma cellulosilyticum TaxID=2802395 RepID=A0A963YX30_9PROT|nr:2-amino-4-hydroxy-6-hydroxymethyldihydropteridine diphosphokinase [Acidisoma cellulosilyticum]MCB8878728.1 2-amino-4-hydroxy-6-hydroxymethyldihydropteridine diphosphokinase [Acidisoma cellulosilyticum]
MILIAFGANLPGPDGCSPHETCRRAVMAVAGLGGLRLDAVSRFYATAPIPVSDQPPYINGVMRLSGEADPAQLLADVLTVEASFGRTRSVANAPRSLDLDLIAIDDLTRGPPIPDPILPHPRMQDRAFVLVPLMDVAPDWRHPVLGETAAELLVKLPDQAIELAEIQPFSGALDASHVASRP